jgi:hypothetical protein
MLFFNFSACFSLIHHGTGPGALRNLQGELSLAAESNTNYICTRIFITPGSSSLTSSDVANVPCSHLMELA